MDRMAELNITRPAVLDAKNDPFNFGSFKIGGVPQQNQVSYQAPISSSRPVQSQSKVEDSESSPRTPTHIQGGSLTTTLSGIGSMISSEAGTAIGGGIGLIGDLALNWWNNKQQEKAINRQMEYLQNQQERVDRQNRRAQMEDRRRFELNRDFQERGFEFNQEQAAKADSQQKFMLALQLLARRAETERGLI